MEREQAIKILEATSLPSWGVCDPVLMNAAQLVLELQEVDDLKALQKAYQIVFSLLERDAFTHTQDLEN